MIDDNSGGIDQSSNTSPYVPSATGGANGGVGFGSSAGFKTIYSRLSYRFNLERNSESRHAIQAAGATGPHDHTYLTFGSFYLIWEIAAAIRGSHRHG